MQFKSIDEVRTLKSHYDVANELFFKKDYDGALAAYHKCIEIDSNHIPSLYKLAQLYNITGDTDKAGSYSQKANGIMNGIWAEKR
ncbi:MAG: tetratricopeptide repeat protein [Nonlabens sp.]|uniref:tetratricopeptide repeat protein n=1 Tax=Nonlabens sp. TaxID=1888209 RepID=UPI003EFA1EF8